MQDAVLAFVRRGRRLLLIFKKRGFGRGKWNAAGGKLLDGETPEACARRELLEETGLRAARLEPRGALRFVFEDKPPWTVHLFVAQGVRGRVRESEECAVAWFDEDRLPFDRMWPDDRYWLPGLLQGQRVQGFFRFDREGRRLLEREVRFF